MLMNFKQPSQALDTDCKLMSLPTLNYFNCYVIWFVLVYLKLLSVTITWTQLRHEPGLLDSESTFFNTRPLHPLSGLSLTCAVQTCQRHWK